MTKDASFRTVEDWAKITDNTKELLKSKNFATAKLEINNLLKKYPNEIKLLNIAADIYRESGDHVRAIEHAELLTILEPDNWVNYLNMSDSWIQLGQIYKAKIAIDNAIKKILTAFFCSRNNCNYQSFFLL